MIHDCAVDPPFLSEECWLKFAIVIKKLAKPGAKVIVCTGMVMRDFLRRILPDLRLSRFKIVHQDSRLSNDFACLVNYCSQDSAFAFIDE